MGKPAGSDRGRRPSARSGSTLEPGDLIALLAALPDPTAILDDGFRVVYSNTAAEMLLGESIGPRSSLSCYILHGLSMSCDHIDPGCPLVSAASKGKPIVRKHVCHLDDGTSRLYEVRVVSAWLRGNDTRWFLEVARDISDSPANAVAIARGKAEWEATVDALTDPVILTALDGTILRCNRATCLSTGTEYGGVLGRQIDELFWTRIDGGPQISRLSARTTDISAAGRWYRVIRYPVQRGGSRIGWVYIIRDQTTEREAREKTVEERERFGSILSSLADAVFAVDSDDRITLMNGAAERMTEVAFSQVGGRRLSDVYRTEVAPEGLDRMARVGTAADAASEAVQLVQLRRPTGPPLQVAQRRSEFRDVAGQRGSVLVVRDVSEIRRLQAIAVSVDLTHNLGSLVAGVRHELGNPVNALKTALTMMRESFGEASPERSLVLLDRALTDASRIERLLERLRKLSLFGDVHPAKHDVAAILRRLTAHGLEAQRREGASLEIEVPSEPVVAWVDPDALEQVVYGFLNNAIAATLGVADRRIWIHLTPEDQSVRLRICDSGPGFTPEALEKAFVPLFTTKQNGTGLGLPIARQLMSEMGATVSVSNAPAGGAVVEVVLSRHQPSVG